MHSFKKVNLVKNKLTIGFWLKVFTFLLLITGIICEISVGQSKKKINWEKDIAFLKKELPERHKNLFFKTSRDTFESRLSGLAVYAKENPSDINIAIRLEQIFAQMGDAHTGFKMLPLLDKKKRFPFKIVWYADGPYLTRASEFYRQIIGKKVLAINHIPWNEVVEKLKTLTVVDNEACIWRDIPVLITSGEILNYFGIAETDSVLLTISDDRNAIQDVWISSQGVRKFDETSLIIMEPLKKTMFYSIPPAIFAYDFNETDSILYFQYNKCWSRELEAQYGDRAKADSLPSFIAITDTIMSMINSGKVSKLIIDFRFNSGGSSQQGSVLAGKIAQNERINQPGKLFVAAGGNTFSSAIINVMDFRKATKAIIIGAPTAGKPNHYGEVRSFKLPSSGLKIYYSTKYFYIDPGNADSIYPDVETKMTFDNFNHGLDPVYEYVRTINK